MGGFHLRECQTLVDQILHTVTNHHDHVPVGGDIGRVRQPPVAGYDPGAALRAVLGKGQIENIVQAGNHATDAPAFRHVDDRIADRREKVAGAYHVGATEEHNAVPVGIWRRRVIDHHRSTTHTPCEL